MVRIGRVLLCVFVQKLHRFHEIKCFAYLTVVQCMHIIV